MCFLFHYVFLPLPVSLSLCLSLSFFLTLSLSLTLSFSLSFSLAPSVFSFSLFLSPSFSLYLFLSPSFSFRTSHNCQVHSRVQVLQMVSPCFQRHSANPPVAPRHLATRGPVSKPCSPLSVRLFFITQGQCYCDVVLPNDPSFLFRFELFARVTVFVNILSKSTVHRCLKYCDF